MIDRFKITGSFENIDLQAVVNNNQLQKCSTGAIIHYNNLHVKNFTGLFIQIKDKISIEGSIHKFIERETNKEFVNYTELRLNDAIEGFKLLEKQTGIPVFDFKVNEIEFGLNLITDKKPVEYMALIKSINGNDLMFNPAFKERSTCATCFSKNKRKYFKLYDKCIEMQEKKYQRPAGEILRIETTHRKNIEFDKQSLKLWQVLHEFHIERLITDFFKTWENVSFHRQLKSVKGFRNNQLEEIKELHEHGADKVKQWIAERERSGVLSEKQARTRREFIRDKWKAIEKELIWIQSKEEIEFKEQIQTLKKKLTCKSGQPNE